VKGESLVGHASEALRIIWKSPQPADQIISEYFRSKKYIGSGERRFLSELVFAALRCYSLALYVGTESVSQRVDNTFTTDDVNSVGNQSAPTEESELAIRGTLALAFSGQIPIDLGASLRRAAGADADGFIATIPPLDPERLPSDLLPCTQPWLLEETKRRWPDDAVNIWTAMLAPAPLCLRVNARRATREQVMAGLIAEGVHCVAGLHAPMAIIIHQRVNLMQHALVLNGIVEVQDEGSQLIALACEAKSGMRVLDACAGAGGKSMHLADIMNDQGEIIARDNEPLRLKETVTRARRAGYRSIIAEFDQRRGAARDRSDMFDIVLIDAPCTGMGTVRRIPLPKWRLTPDQLKRHTKKQRALLEENAGKVVEGGSLVYATCSVLPAENEDVVAAFLAMHPEYSLEASNQVDPYHHGTDGLVWARLRRE
jgi:16S rRNA (cytosine967-C5)-methyltransferase